MTTLVAVRDHSTGRIEHEVFGSLPHADVPSSPYYRPTPGSFITARAWLDDDGQHVVAAHDCTAERIVHLLPWPTWQVVGQDVTPSYSCGACGIHAFLTINATALA